jgi:uncharacterized membrane protein
MALPADSPPFVHLSVPNRSLGPAARRWVLVAIAATPLALATAAWVIGAWLVLPFAGLEIAALVLAFHVLGAHDADFEKLEIGDEEVRVEARDAERVTRFVAHRPWARVVFRERGARCTLGLAYAGRVVPLGRLLSDEGRRRLAAKLRGWIPVIESR